MYLLSAISVVCFFALICTAIAVTRRVNSSRRSADPQSDFAQHLVAACSNHNFREPRTHLQQTVGEVMAKKRWNHILTTATPQPALQMHMPSTEKTAATLNFTRKPPQSAHSKTWKHLDRAGFNQALGNITDSPRIQASGHRQPNLFKHF